ncbi:hypothetical protein F5Y03DRAFT_297920 [Xylaria venustula]|nr:hypothetical protein F5Y03DRAFT_297920 [Xylaria venustula]
MARAFVITQENAEFEISASYPGILLNAVVCISPIILFSKMYMELKLVEWSGCPSFMAKNLVRTFEFVVLDTFIKLSTTYLIIAYKATRNVILT